MMTGKGTLVKWKWGSGYAEDRVSETYDHKVMKKINDTKVTRNGERNNKALYIEQEDGSHVLKSESEVQKQQ